MHRLRAKSRSGEKYWTVFFYTQYKYALWMDRKCYRAAFEDRWHWQAERQEIGLGTSPKGLHRSQK